ncbi:S-glutathionyl-(chloro)hydroquinone reductase, partial [Tulasnella sp. 418]
MATDKQNSSGMAKLVTEKDGSFKRQESAFRNTIEVGGVHPPEKGRYHLYVAYGCPWATRTIILRKLKGLEDIVGLTVVSPLLGSLGWAFKKADDYPGAEDDPLYGFNHLREFYFKVDPTYQGR